MSKLRNCSPFQISNFLMAQKFKQFSTSKSFFAFWAVSEFEVLKNEPFWSFDLWFGVNFPLLMSFLAIRRYFSYILDELKFEHTYFSRHYSRKLWLFIGDCLFEFRVTWLFFESFSLTYFTNIPRNWWIHHNSYKFFANMHFSLRFFTSIFLWKL